MNKQVRYRPIAGFTLVEMLVVLMIAGILALIAAPGWLGFMNSRRADAGREQVLQILRQAQAQAIRTRQIQVVDFITPANELPIVRTSGISQRLDGQVTNNPNPKMLKLDVINGNVGCSSGATGCVVFDDRGNILRDAAGLGDDGMKIVITSPASNTSDSNKRCVIVKTLLGAMQSSRGNDCK